jgi:hypothetical protein
MKHFVGRMDRGQSTLIPECLQDWIGEDNPVRVIDVFVDELDLAELTFSSPKQTCARSVWRLTCQRSKPATVCTAVIAARRPIPVRSFGEPCWISGRSSHQFWRGMSSGSETCSPCDIRPLNRWSAPRLLVDG